METQKLRITTVEGNKLSRAFLKKKDFDTGLKRVNLNLSISEAELLLKLSKSKSALPTTYARMILVEGLRRMDALYPVKELLGQQNIFQKEKKRRGNSVKI